MLRIFLVPQIKILRITDFFISKKKKTIVHKKTEKGCLHTIQINYRLHNRKHQTFRRLKVRMECVWRVVLSDREKRRLIHYRPQVYTLFY